MSGRPTHPGPSPPRPRPDAYPLAHAAAPAHDARLEPGVGADVGVAQHRAPPDAHAVLHHHAGTQAHVGADAAVLANAGAWILRAAGKAHVGHSSPQTEGVKDGLDKGLTTSTLPTMPGPEHSCSGCFCRSDCRKRHMPVRKSLGCPMSIQKPGGRECISGSAQPQATPPCGLPASPCSSMAYSCPSLAMTGKTSFSMDVGRSCGSGQRVSRGTVAAACPPSPPESRFHTPGCAAARPGSGCTCPR